MASQLTTNNAPLIHLAAITKSFPGVTANSDVNLSVQEGSIHAIIGENGAGKSTLLGILYGRYRPDSGTLKMNGADVELRSPSDAIRNGIGLVSQHHTLIPALSVLDNIILGAEPTRSKILISRQSARERIGPLAHSLGLANLDLNSPASRLSLATRQKVELLKSLYRGARVLLLDEPTATLAPSEVEELFRVLRQLSSQGTTIIFVTHKLQEVMTLCDHVSVLCQGKNAGDFCVKDIDEDELLARMVPERLVAVVRTSHNRFEQATTSSPLPLLDIQNLSVASYKSALAIRDLSLRVFPGEIVGIAGVDGSGQRELAEAIVGIRPVHSGHIVFGEICIEECSVRMRRRRGISYIPEDRHHEGLVLGFSVSDNYLLGHEGDPSWGGGLLLNPNKSAARARDMIQCYDVRVGQGGVETAVGTLSGGNQQKVVIARAMADTPRLLVACQPTRGLDIEATRFVHDVLCEARSQGAGILLFSLDLDEIFALSDRIGVLFRGCLADVHLRAQTTVQQVGTLMTGVTGTRPAHSRSCEQGSSS